MVIYMDISPPQPPSVRSNQLMLILKTSHTILLVDTFKCYHSYNYGALICLVKEMENSRNFFNNAKKFGLYLLDLSSPNLESKVRVISLQRKYVFILKLIGQMLKIIRISNDSLIITYQVLLIQTFLKFNECNPSFQSFPHQ